MSLINTVLLSRGAVPWGWVREKGSLRGRQWQPRKIVMHPRREESPGAPGPLLPPLLLIVSIKATGTVTEKQGPKGDGSRVHSANYNNCYLMLCVCFLRLREHTQCQNRTWWYWIFGYLLFSSLLKNICSTDTWEIMKARPRQP